MIALESRREDLYVQFYERNGEPLCEPAAIMPSVLGDVVDATIGGMPLLIAGDAAQRASVALAQRPDTAVLKGSTPDASAALRAGLRLLRLEKSVGTPRPLYLRPPDVTLPNGSREAKLTRT
jgi:tRNA threonylcarbamoyladenosine biosynthesis protein TsaB